MIPTLSGACYAVKSIVRDSDINTLKSIYFHSITKYGIILGGNSSNSLQSKIVRIMTDEQPKV
jgi:NADH:ubiquinone oxidoreductase subunit H